MVKLISKRMNRDIDVFYASLIFFSEVEFLPEIYDIFGKDNTLQFLDIFAGRVIRIPSEEELRDCARHVKIWLSLQRDKSKETYKMLMSEFAMDKDEVKKAYKEACVKFKDLGIELSNE